nr:ATP synthase F0 subunit 8 [Sylvicola punctatus]
MPQMAPISWLSLFIIFSITFMIFNVLNYFSFLPPTPKSMDSDNKNISKTNNSLTWKW